MRARGRLEASGTAARRQQWLLLGECVRACGMRNGSWIMDRLRGDPMDV